MGNDTSYIISIWLVDPVGGVFVDWPENLEDGCLLNASDLKNALIAEVKFVPYFEDVGDNLAVFWIAHEQLGSAMRDLEVALSARDSEFRISYEKMLKACEFAHSLDNAGVYIG